MAESSELKNLRAQREEISKQIRAINRSDRSSAERRSMRQPLVAKKQKIESRIAQMEADARLAKAKKVRAEEAKAKPAKKESMVKTEKKDEESKPAMKDGKGLKGTLEDTKSKIKKRREYLESI